MPLFAVAVEYKVKCALLVLLGELNELECKHVHVIVVGEPPVSDDISDVVNIVGFHLLSFSNFC